MKKILITGANSYIGTSFEKYMAQWQDQYQVDTVDMIGDTWKEKSFAGYDCVFHVAGIAHIKETKDNFQLYYTVNRDLAVDTAKKAKCDGVKQFIFLSTMAVYGMIEGKVTTSTLPAPKTNYGKAKYEAEQQITALKDDSFKTVIVRPPTVYGDGCKGNYRPLERLAQIAPFFPNYHNTRSMIHIDRLCWFVKNFIDHESDGLFLPQDEQYVCTCRMVQQIAKRNGKKLPLLTVLNPMVSLLKVLTSSGRKAFGSLYYEMTEIDWE